MRIPECRFCKKYKDGFCEKYNIEVDGNQANKLCFTPDFGIKIMHKRVI